MKLAAPPWLNESWHASLYVSGTSCTTGLVTDGEVGFELAFNFAAGELRLLVSGGGSGAVPLLPKASPSSTVPS